MDFSTSLHSALSNNLSIYTLFKDPLLSDFSQPILPPIAPIP